MGYRYNKSHTCAFNCFRIEIIGPSSPSLAWTHWAASLGGISRAAPALKTTPENMDVLTIFFYIYQPGLPWNKRDPPANSPFGVRSLDMSDVLTIDRESLGKIQHRTTKNTAFMIICGAALGQGFKKPDEMNFQLSPYLGRGVCPKLLQSNLSSIFSSLSTKHQTLPDQMIKYSHNLCSTIAIIFVVSRSRRLLQRRLQLCFYYPQRRCWWIHIFMWTARTRRKIFWSSLPLLLFMITNIHRGTHECFTYTAYTDVFRIVASFWTVYCLRLVRWERCKDMRRKWTKSHSTGQHTHPPANSSNIFSNRNIRILLWLDPIVAYSTYHLTIPWSVHHKMANCIWTLHHHPHHPVPATSLAEGPRFNGTQLPQ